MDITCYYVESSESSLPRPNEPDCAHFLWFATETGHKIGHSFADLNVSFLCHLPLADSSGRQASN